MEKIIKPMELCKKKEVRYRTHLLIKLTISFSVIPKYSALAC